MRKRHMVSPFVAVVSQQRFCVLLSHFALVMASLEGDLGRKSPPPNPKANPLTIDEPLRAAIEETVRQVFKDLTRSASATGGTSSTSVKSWESLL